MGGNSSQAQSWPSIQRDRRHTSMMIGAVMLRLVAFALLAAATGFAGTAMIITADVFGGIMVRAVIRSVLGERDRFSDGEDECRNAKSDAPAEGGRCCCHAGETSGVPPRI